MILLLLVSGGVVENNLFFDFFDKFGYYMGWNDFEINFGLVWGNIL